MFAEEPELNDRLMMQILKYLDKKLLDLLSISAILILFVLFYSVFLKDDIATHASLKKRLLTLKSSTEKSALLMEAQKNRASDIEALEKEITDYKNIFQAANKTAYLLNYMTTLARRHRVEVASVEPGEVIKGDSFTKSMYTTSITGGFYDIHNFLYRIEEDWKAVKIERVVMDKDIEDSRIHVMLTVAVLSI